MALRLGCKLASFVAQVSCLRGKLLRSRLEACTTNNAQPRPFVGFTRLFLAMRSFDRIVLVVLDSLGIGAQPDAADWGDAGRDTLGHIAEHYPLKIPNFVRLGLANIRVLTGIKPAARPEGAYGK